VLGEDLTPRGLRRALAVDVGGVEERDAGVKGGLGAGRGLLGLDAPGVGKSGAEGDDGHLQVGGAEGAVTHGVPLWVVSRTGLEGQRRVPTGRVGRRARPARPRAGLDGGHGGDVCAAVPSSRSDVESVHSRPHPRPQWLPRMIILWCRWPRKTADQGSSGAA